MVVIERFLSCSLRKARGETAAWRFVTEYHVADGSAHLCTSKPYIHDGWQVLLLPLHGGGTSGEVQEHHGLTCGHESLEQMALALGQINVCTAMALSTPLGTFSSGKDNDIGL